MRNISFMLTTEQVRAKTKTVTRRMGWDFLRAGDRLCAVEKGQGLGKGGKVNRICTIQVVSVRKERLDRMIEDREYGIDETAREGFPEPHEKADPAVFVRFFCASHSGCKPDSLVSRIEFCYVD